MEWFLKAFKQYAEFKGRARRKEYWMFWLFNYLFTLIIFIVETSYSDNFKITILFSLLMFLPSLAVTVRRLHDVDKSGWFVLINLIPLIGQIWLLLLLITDSTIGTNKYGENPKGINVLIEKEKIEDNTFFYLVMSFLISAFVAFGSYALFSYLGIFEETILIRQIIMTGLFIVTFYFSFNAYVKDEKNKKLEKL